MAAVPTSGNRQTSGRNPAIDSAMTGVQDSRPWRSEKSIEISAGSCQRMNASPCGMASGAP